MLSDKMRTWMEAIVAYFKALSHYSPGENEGKLRSTIVE
jgi:hypothetical protein